MSKRIMCYTWTGINIIGKKISGTINAANKTIAKEKLEKTNLTVLSLKINNFTLSFTKKRFTPKNRFDFTQQLHLLLQASIPLADALELIANTADNMQIKTMSTSLKEKIISGISFSEALNTYSSIFEKAFCQMISAGEQSGKLEIVLAQLLENQEHVFKIKNNIAKALFYPSCILLIAFIISIGLLIFVIPQFSLIYNNFGAKLPIMTRCLISTSHYLCQQGIYYLIIIFLIAVILKRTITEKNRMQQFVFKLPFYQSLLVTHEIAQWSQLIAMTLSAGISLIDALHIANQAITQSRLQAQMQQVRETVIIGKSLYAALDLCHFFPMRAKTMINIGENSDALPYMMEKISSFYQQQLNETLERLSKLLEPVIMLIVSGFVSGLIVAMYLPIFRMGSVI
ncbi:MAG: hypothetical protein A3E82_05400 [Gammaproteobacteria bacterium RIFCSPHIGHO2_12_FULL_38_11]|nr:MAG: hypothetical protein A3E82_05400 [Gammaproteobacteria bacterium RIFCSPHIGHO2_12_FULL_38_11]